MLLKAVLNEANHLPTGSWRLGSEFYQFGKRNRLKLVLLIYPENRNVLISCQLPSLVVSCVKYSRKTKIGISQDWVN